MEQPKYQFGQTVYYISSGGVMEVVIYKIEYDYWGSLNTYRYKLIDTSTEFLAESLFLTKEDLIKSL